MSSNPTGYSVLNYGHMASSRKRMDAYARALREAMPPGAKVLDIGAGFGIFSLLACQYGADEVIALEPDSSVMLLPSIAKANGFAGKIDVVNAISQTYQSDRKADLLISDIRGPLPLFENHIPTIIDARERLIKPGAVIIPQVDTLKLAVVCSPATYEPCLMPWLTNDYGLDLSQAHRFAVNVFWKVYLEPDDLLTDAAVLGELDYRQIATPNFSSEVQVCTSRAGEAHGIVIWFDTQLLPGIGFSNAPGEEKLVYGQIFFPFEHAILAQPGDTFKIAIQARHTNDGYTWVWDTKYFPKSAEEPLHSFRQSNFLGTVPSPAKLALQDRDHVPEQRPEYAIDGDLLSLIDGKVSLGSLAADLLQRFPAQFRSLDAAHSHLVKLIGRYR